MKRGLLAVLILLLCLSLFVKISPTPVLAQRETPTPVPDRDGDGVPDNEDGCPSEPGPASNKGCPLPDSDGDGVPDNTDQCPNEPGPVSNNGCPAPPNSPGQPVPTEAPPQPTPTPQIVLPALPIDGPCLIATQGTQRVNLRREPSALDPDNIIDQLQPSESGRQAYLKYELKNVLITSYSVSGSGDAAGHEKEIEILSWSWGETRSELTETWFLVDSPAGPAWASGGVIRQGGDCDTLPAVHSSNNLKQIGIALHSINYNWGVLEGWLPDLGVDENGLPFVQCDATLQQIIECDDSLPTQDGLSNTIFLGETSDTNTNGVVDAADYLVWRKNLGGLGEFAILPPDSEEIALLVPAIQSARAAANNNALPLLNLLADQGALPDSARKNGAIIFYDTEHAADDMPTEEVAFYFAPILNLGDNEEESQIIVGLGEASGDPGSHGIILFDWSPAEGAMPQGTILIIPVMDDQGGLQDVIVQVLRNPGPPETPGSNPRPIIIGRLPNPDMNGLVLLIPPPLDDDSIPAEEKWLHTSYVSFSW